MCLTMLGLAACSGGGSTSNSASTSTTTTSKAPPTTTTTLPPTTVTTGTGLGATQTSTSGVSVTVFSFENPAARPLSDSSSSPDTPGDVFAVLDAQVCAGINTYSLNPIKFVLVNAANQQSTLFDVSPEPFQPAMGTPDLAPRECVRGLIAYEVAPGAQFVAVRWQDSDGGPLRWSV